MKQLLKSKMKGIPEADQEKIFAMLEKNPNLFKQIAEEVQAKMKAGKDQMTAVREVMMAHEAELKALKGEMGK